MINKTTVDTQEIAKFAQLASQWWDKDGSLKTLHDINPARMTFIQQQGEISNKKILDLGCGGGILSEALAQQGGIVTGIDAEVEAIQSASYHAQNNQLSIEYICTPIEDYTAEPFDLITCMELLEHVTEPFLIIEHCARLLKPGGVLFLSTLNRTMKAYLSAVLAAEYILNILPRQTHDYNKFIKPAELASMLRKAGFEVIGLQGLAYNPLTRTATLSQDVSINYLVSCFKA